LKGHAVDPVTPLVRVRGAEIGVRTVAAPDLHITATLWTLASASELVFAGDAGTTEATRRSHRYGVEWANYYTPRRWVILDADVAWSNARFTDVNAAGDRIPGSVGTVLSAGATVDSLHNVFGSLRVRYFGPRALIEDNSVRSKATALVNLDAGYKLTKQVKFVVNVFNLLDSSNSDIDYYYASRLPGEPVAGVNDVHFHPALPRTARVNLVFAF
jgi:outer membrane receptor protein involved in Fe transport